MTFQFLCPQGHLLEGEESQMGQPCDCPMCGMRFIIPTIEGAQPGGGQQHGGYDQGGYEQGYSDPGYGGGYQDPTGGFDPNLPQAGPIDPFASAEEGGSGFEEMGGLAEVESVEPQMLHIPCPDGHELETPPEMVGQDVLCPYCGVQFNLRYKDSVEYKRERAAELERKEQKAGKLWFQWAIIAAIVVLGGLVGMIVYTIVQSQQS